MKYYRIAPILSLALCLTANVSPAQSTPIVMDDFEAQEIVVQSGGNEEHYKINKIEGVTNPVHSGKQSCKIDITTGADYPKTYLYLYGKKLRIVPEPGQKLEGWMKVDPATSSGVKVKLGVSVVYPQTPTSAEISLEIVEHGEDGWMKYQSEDLLERFTRLAEEKHWSAEKMFVQRWMLHLTGTHNLANKRVVVYIDDLVIK
ncbi:MAG: hypothetical protein WC765_05570 [Phycisphaerae bacterium]|jgi:hypothetical protein